MKHDQTETDLKMYVIPMGLRIQNCFCAVDPKLAGHACEPPREGFKCNSESLPAFKNKSIQAGVVPL